MEDCKKYSVIWANTKNQESLNLGDDIRTLAAIEFLRKKNITEYSFIDRETIKLYDGPEVNVIMNGWFIHDKSMFPPSDKITPIYISFHCSDESLIKDNITHFKKYEPIGCRDTYTLNLLTKYNIKAHFTGCLTLIFDPVINKSDNIILNDINMCSYIPQVQFNKNKYIKLEITNHQIYDPLMIVNVESRLKYANELLNKYKNAKLVLTNRLHCALPCRAFNTPVKFIHRDFNTEPRFSGLNHILNGGNTDDSANSKVDRKIIDNIVERFMAVVI